MNLKPEDIFDLLLQDGEIIDPDQGLHCRGSLAIKNGRIAGLGQDLPGEAAKVIPLQGKIITPGLIDLHCHPSLGFYGRGIPPDEVGLNAGVTLLGDGGPRERPTSMLSTSWSSSRLKQKSYAS